MVNGMDLASNSKNVRPFQGVHREEAEGSMQGFGRNSGMGQRSRWVLKASLCRVARSLNIPQGYVTRQDATSSKWLTHCESGATNLGQAVVDLLPAGILFCRVALCHAVSCHASGAALSCGVVVRHDGLRCEAPQHLCGTIRLAIQRGNRQKRIRGAQCGIEI